MLPSAGGCSRTGGAPHGWIIWMGGSSDPHKGIIVKSGHREAERPTLFIGSWL